MPAPRPVKVVVGFQAFEGILADRLEHAQAGLTVGALGHRDQADVMQLGDKLQRIGIGVAGHGHRGERVKVASPGEDAHPAEHLGRVRGQQVIAPGHEIPQGLLARRPSGLGGGQAQALPEAGEQRLGSQQPDPGRGQFDGQRQPVQAAADGRDVGGVVRGDSETRPDHARLLGEQPHRGGRRDRVQVGAPGHAKRRHRELMLVLDVQRAA